MAVQDRRLALLDRQALYVEDQENVSDLALKSCPFSGPYIALYRFSKDPI